MSSIPNMFGDCRSHAFDPFLMNLWAHSGGSAVANKTTVAAKACVDWKETAEAHVLKVDLPGVKKGEVKVEVENGCIIQISGERRLEEEKNENVKWRLVERSSGKFMRRFRLPENANLAKAKVAMENGVLTVTVPKEEPKQVQVPKEEPKQKQEEPKQKQEEPKQVQVPKEEPKQVQVKVTDSLRELIEELRCMNDVVVKVTDSLHELIEELSMNQNDVEREI
ncbi:17.6 kDa class I heat shock protein-like isoform X2 [Salvia miltiorrhiza]|uniref:17.6 kDa class I heat shock protein-like isoform X2 n=1 Tax=Salvia miltiorrhiza TaxID=226208 RepID=UPI0025AD48EC|nr:17.6 kDa class I heat shock protein-like isoform X2 [Salvia miltiorrhiza]